MTTQVTTQAAQAIMNKPYIGVKLKPEYIKQSQTAWDVMLHKGVNRTAFKDATDMLASDLLNRGLSIVNNEIVFTIKDVINTSFIKLAITNLLETVNNYFNDRLTKKDIITNIKENKIK